jgi:hypothetical protein
MDARLRTRTDKQWHCVYVRNAGAQWLTFPSNGSICARSGLFGGLQLETSDGAQPRFATRKARELFAYLILNRGHMQSREQLADLCWPDSESERARRALNTTVWRIQKVVGASPGRDSVVCHLLVKRPMPETQQVVADLLAGDRVGEEAMWSPRSSSGKPASTTTP